MDYPPVTPNDPDIEEWIASMDSKVSSIGDNTGPVFVTDGVPRDRFMRMYEVSRGYKRKMLWKEDGGKLFIQADYTEVHEQAKCWLHLTMVMDFMRLGIPFLGSGRQVSLCTGGLMELADRIQQVDLFLLEKLSEEEPNFRNAKVILAAQVVHVNEDPRTVFDDMEVLVREDGGAKVALGIILQKKPYKVFYRNRLSKETQVIDAIEGNVIKLNWEELFDKIKVQGETIIDLGLLVDHVDSI